MPPQPTSRRPAGGPADGSLSPPDHETLLKAVVEGVVDSVVTINEAGIIQWCNPATVRLFGYGLDALLGQNVSLLMPPPFRDEHDQYLANYLGGAPAKIIGIGREVQGRRRDGTLFPLELAVTESMLHGRRVFTGMIRDLTEKKMAEQRLLQAERLAAIGQMVTGLAHECRNALQRTHACLEMLEMEVAEQPRSLDLVQRIMQAQNEIQRLFDEVSNFAKPQRLEITEVELPRVWREAWTLLSEQRAGRDAKLRESFIDLESTPAAEHSTSRISCPGDHFRLTQVFRNLFENSLAAAADPVEIQIECRPGRQKDQPIWEIRVRDNGPGLTEEQQKRIFEPFYTTKSKGTGLGMPIARRIIEAHGGTLTSGAAGPGAEFLITLPCPDGPSRKSDVSSA